MSNFVARRARFFFLFGAVMASPVFSQPVKAPTLTALSGLQYGEWQLREQGGGNAQSLCVSDPIALIQVEHPQTSCTRFVVQNDPKIATVSYNCPGAGSGRTTIRVETPRLVQIETQGISRNGPFSTRFEGRRTGVCSGGINAQAFTGRLPNRAISRPVLSFK